MDQTRLKELVKYDSSTGLFTWLRKYSKARDRGDLAGYLTVKGYVHIGADRKIYKAHRLAWLYVTGQFPPGEIDHVDGDRANNRFSNLRVVTREVNIQNMHKPTRRNKSGHLGVYADGGRWRAEINANKTRVRLGYFRTPEAADEAYRNAKKRLHPESVRKDLFGD